MSNFLFQNISNIFGAPKEVIDIITKFEPIEEPKNKINLELSEDGGSNTNGGLYTKVLKGQMVTEFNDWLFDESRKPGDTGIVYGESSNYAGYHVMYFVGDDVPCWQVQVENTLRSRDTEAWQKGLTDSAEVVQLSGMKHVG